MSHHRAKNTHQNINLNDPVCFALILHSNYQDSCLDTSTELCIILHISICKDKHTSHFWVGWEWGKEQLLKMDILSERTAKQMKTTFPFKSSGGKKTLKNNLKTYTFKKFDSEDDLPTTFKSVDSFAGGFFIRLFRFLCLHRICYSAVRR